MAICQEISELTSRVCGAAGQIETALQGAKDGLAEAYQSLKGFVEDETTGGQAASVQAQAPTQVEGVL